MPIANDEEAPAGAEDAAGDASWLLRRLRRNLGWLALVTVAGGAIAYGGARLATPSWRATAVLYVVEPRIGGSGGSVDYNLTPIRSYSALVSSPAVAEACRDTLGAGGRETPRLRVRMPENTRLLEISVSAGGAREAAAYVNCVAARAVEENSRFNERVAGSLRDLAERARREAEGQSGAIAREVAELRRREHVELRRAELKGALAEVEAGATDERRAEVELAEAEARRKSFGESEAASESRRRFLSTVSAEPSVGAVGDRSSLDVSAGTPVVREEADPVHDAAGEGRVGAAAAEAAARAALAGARARRTQAAKRAAELEERIAAIDASLGAATKRWDGSVSALSELERRLALSRIESAAKAFELVPFSAAASPTTPESPRPRLAAAAGALAAAMAGVLRILSSPGRSAPGVPRDERG